tara:strand:+ start:61 stop:690 length:630 start_codon:yes stop_codon:yes gene_type:complete
MFNLRYIYNQNSISLQIEGFPDFSIGQNNETIGILTDWKLQIAGYPELQGKKEHLQELLNVIYPYCRYYLLGIINYNDNIDNSQPVSIFHIEEGHQLILRSSQKQLSPLKIVLDDAELVDLVNCLDKFRNDYRIKLSWNYGYSDFINSKINFHNKFNYHRLIPSLTAGISLIVTSFAFIISSNNTRFIEIKGSDSQIEQIERNNNNNQK